MSGDRGDAGCHLAGGSRMEADASMGRRLGKHDGWRPDRKGHVSPSDCTLGVNGEVRGAVRTLLLDPYLPL
jgi:hypothetical protein